MNFMKFLTLSFVAGNYIIIFSVRNTFPVCLIAPELTSTIKIPCCSSHGI